MIWLILVALSVAGGHWLLALAGAVLALPAQPRRRLRVVIVRPAPGHELPATPYDLAVAKRRERRLRLVHGGKRDGASQRTRSN